MACVWLPQLPLRMEVLRHPAWDGLPLVLGSPPGERKVVQLCSPEAQEAGIRPGLPLREVVPLCRAAIVVQPDPVRLAALLTEVMAGLQQVSHAVEPDDAGFLFLDLRGLERLYEGELASLERAIRSVVPPLLRPRLGFARGKLAASVAARESTPSAARVVAGPETTRFLAPLPVSYLPFEPAVLQRLELLGLRTVGALAALPFRAVQAEFGPAGARAWRLARGQDNEPLIPRPVALFVRSALRFDDPLASIEAMMAALDQLLAQTFDQPALTGRSVRQARLRALLADSTSWERLYTFKEALATRGAARLALKTRLELPNGFPPAPIDELALELLGMGGLAARQERLFVVARARQLGQVAEAGRQLRARYGHLPLYYAREVEPWSRLPERRWALVTCDL